MLATSILPESVSEFNNTPPDLWSLSMSEVKIFKYPEMYFHISGITKLNYKVRLKEGIQIRFSFYQMKWSINLYHD